MELSCSMVGVCGWGGECVSVWVRVWMVGCASVRVCMSVLCLWCKCICKAAPLCYTQHNALTGTVAPTTFDPVPPSRNLHPLTKLCHTKKHPLSLNCVLDQIKWISCCSNLCIKLIDLSYSRVGSKWLHHDIMMAASRHHDVIMTSSWSYNKVGELPHYPYN